MAGGYSKPGTVVAMHIRDPSVPNTAACSTREMSTVGSGMSGETEVFLKNVQLQVKLISYQLELKGRLPVMWFQ